MPLFDGVLDTCVAVFSMCFFIGGDAFRLWPTPRGMTSIYAGSHQTVCPLVSNLARGRHPLISRTTIKPTDLIAVIDCALPFVRGRGKRTSPSKMHPAVHRRRNIKWIHRGVKTLPRSSVLGLRARYSLLPTLRIHHPLPPVFQRARKWQHLGVMRLIKVQQATRRIYAQEGPSVAQQRPGDKVHHPRVGTEIRRVTLGIVRWGADINSKGGLVRRREERNGFWLAESHKGVLNASQAAALIWRDETRAAINPASVRRSHTLSVGERTSVPDCRPAVPFRLAC